MNGRVPLCQMSLKKIIENKDSEFGRVDLHEGQLDPLEDSNI